MAALWDAVSAFNALSTTSPEFLHGAQPPTFHVDPRAMLWSAARAQGWAGLNSISLDALSKIGTLRHLDNGIIVQQDEQVYIRQVMSRVLLDIFSRAQSRALLSPGLIDTISHDFAGAGGAVLDNTLLSTPPFDDEAITSFIAATIADAASLAGALIHYIDEDPAVARAFRRFAEDPTSWSGYVQSYSDSPSIQEIVRRLHRPRGPSFRTLTIVVRPGNRSKSEMSPFTKVIPTFFHHGAPGQTDALGVDAESAIGPFALHDEDIEYIAALFIAALLRFHN